MFRWNVYVGGRVGSGKFVLAKGSVSSKYWTLQVNAILTVDSVEINACVLLESLDGPCGGVVSRDHISLWYAELRQWLFISYLLPKMASSTDSTGHLLLIETSLWNSNNRFPNQISLSPLTKFCTNVTDPLPWTVYLARIKVDIITQTDSFWLVHYLSFIVTG